MPDTALPRNLADAVHVLTGSADRSGFLILDKGSESLKARIAMINSARETLNLQYYAISNDVTSNLLIEALIRAAERGVRVRMLIDDISVGRVYRSLRYLDSLPNIEVRIFNPITTESQNYPARFIAFFSNLKRAKRRMHNKAIITDGLLCMTGGRNLGDEYFDTHPDMSFKDIDALAIGGITAQVTEIFDLFWNHHQCKPLNVLYGILQNRLYGRLLRARLRKSWIKTARGPEGDTLSMDFSGYVESAKAVFIIAEAEFLSDKPDKVTGDDDNSPMTRIKTLALAAQKDFVLVSPYFVPDGDDLAWIKTIARRGVRVRVLTNSLAATDVVAVHTGYAPQRKDLLAHGIKLFELKRVGPKRTRQRIFGRGAPSYASLHAKTYVVDGRISIIGSLNFDPRSLNFNTESALIIHSAETSRILNGLFDDAVEPETSYRISTDDTGDIVFHSVKDGKAVTEKEEPDCSPWRRLQCFLISFLPVRQEL